MSTKAPECWATDASAKALRIEVSTEKSLLLKFDQFLYAEFEKDEHEQTLRLFFATHEVVIHGHTLRRIETALQRMELSYLATLPHGHRSVLGDGHPSILKIAVSEKGS